MNTAPDQDQLGRAVAALAAELERQGRQLSDQRDATGRAQESADHAHRVLIDIVDRIKQIADRQPAGEPAAAAGGKPVSWLTINDPATAHAALADLADWLQSVYVHYPGAAESLGECWPWHPAAVEELMALRAAWHAAYTSTDGAATRAVDWHDRHLPGVTRRLRAALGDCSITAHRRGGRADHLSPQVPAAAAVNQLADWWATTHGTTAAPAPTPDLEAATTGGRP